MFVHWEGRGWLVPAIGFGCSWAMEALIEAATGDARVFQRRGWPICVSLTVSAVTIWYLANRFDRRTLLESLTGGGTASLPNEAATSDGIPKSDPDPPPVHSFMWIPMRFWAPILLIAAAVMALRRA